MDVNGIRVNSINSDVYNSNLSEYAQTNKVEGVQKVESESLKANNNQEYSKKELEEAVKKLNNFLKDENTHAEYSYYKDLKTTMVKIVDEDTKEVILEIPPKKILDMVASMMRQVGLLDKRA